VRHVNASPCHKLAPSPILQAVLLFHFLFRTRFVLNAAYDLRGGGVVDSLRGYTCVWTGTQGVRSRRILIFPRDLVHWEAEGRETRQGQGVVTAYLGGWYREGGGGAYQHL